MAKTKKIVIALSDDGRMLTDLEGFDGDECLKDAELLRQELAKLGVKIDDVFFKRKPPQIPELTPTHMPVAQKEKK